MPVRPVYWLLVNQYEYFIDRQMVAWPRRRSVLSQMLVPQRLRPITLQQNSSQIVFILG